jgi:hypothetical protein
MGAMAGATYAAWRQFALPIDLEADRLVSGWQIRPFFVLPNEHDDLEALMPLVKTVPQEGSWVARFIAVFGIRCTWDSA